MASCVLLFSSQSIWTVQAAAFARRDLTMNCPTIKIGWASKYASKGSRANKRPNQTRIQRERSGNNHVRVIDLPIGIEPLPPPPPDPTRPPPLCTVPIPPPQRLPIPPANYDDMVLNEAQVKSVLSGDSIILQSNNNPGSERTLSLAYVDAPHLRKDGDDPYAFESRDALRKLLVGKVVQFNVLYTIPHSQREYGLVYFNDGRRLPELMLEEGWLKLRDDAGKKEVAEEALQHLETLRKLEAKARSEHKGLFAPGGKAPTVQHTLGGHQEFLKQHKGKEVTGIVEKVFSGDRLLIRLLESDDLHIQGKQLFNC